MRGLTKAFAFGRDTAAVTSVAQLEEFVATRAAYVGQTKLYGYLKTRIGTRYPRVFDDEIFVHSINIAKYHVFAACLSDLSIYSVATALQSAGVSDEERCQLALRCFRHGLMENSQEMPVEFPMTLATEGFARRLKATDWRSGALDRSNFTESPAALLRWAPIAENLKAEDAEIVKNSIRFAWRDIREQFRKRLVAEALVADLKATIEVPS